MRCPKCHYLSFDPEARCRNCGYDFSLADPDLQLRLEEDAPARPADIMLRPPPARTAAPKTLGPMRPQPVPARPAVTSSAVADRPREAAAASSPAAEPPPPRGVVDSPAGQREPPARLESPAQPAVTRPPKQASPVPASTPGDLPLFVRGMPARPAPGDDAVPEVPAAPPPLSVRRRTPDPARLKARYGRESVGRAPGPVDRDLLDDLEKLEQMPRPASPAPMAQPVNTAWTNDAPPPARLAARVAAGIVDAAVLGAIDVAVIALTLRLSDLPASQAAVLPLLPLAAFFVLLNGGYLLLFTAVNGQTVGKMAAHIRVVAEPGRMPRPRVTLAQAATRSLCALGSALALGAGFLTSLGPDGRALHDRVAGTRIVRA